MTFAWPWVLLALPLPVLVWWLMPSAESRDCLHHPALAGWAAAGAAGTPDRRAYRGLWLWLAWALLVLALARPQTPGPPLVPEYPGRSLMLVVDMSRSMAERDMVWQDRRVSRYQAVQSVVGEFVREREGDALGLVVFGRVADIQAPLTPDRQAVEALLRDLQPGMAGAETAIGDGLAMAVKRLRDVPVPDKVIILLSDGRNTAGELRPRQAAKAAADSGIRVYTIGFGPEASAGLFGMTRAGVDAETLRALAEQTQGRFFRARSAEELQAVYDRIDELEPSALAGDRERQAREWFWLPSTLALVLIMAGRHLPPWRGRAVA